MKRGVVRSLVRRAEEISSDDQLLKKEMRHLKTVLPVNGYPSNLVRATQERKTRDTTVEEEEEEKKKPAVTAVIPYSQGLSEQIRRVLRKHNIRTAFRSGLSLGKLLTKVKDPVPPEDRSGVVYKISCLCGDSYIGETGRNAIIRIKEHKAACRLVRFEKSAVADSAWLDGHIIEWDQMEILDTAKDLNERNVKETLYIKLAPQGCRINRDEGKELSPLWLNAIKRQCSRGSAHREMDGQERNLGTTVTAMHQPHPPPTPPPNIRRPTPTIKHPTSHMYALTGADRPGWPDTTTIATPPGTVTI